MEYKQIHVVWGMILDTELRCNFKTYPLENSSKHTRQEQDYYPQNYHW